MRKWNVSLTVTSVAVDAAWQTLRLSPHRDGLGESRWTRLGKAGMWVGDVSPVPHAQVRPRPRGSMGDLGCHCGGVSGVGVLGAPVPHGMWRAKPGREWPPHLSLRGQRCRDTQQGAQASMT